MIQTKQKKKLFTAEHYRQYCQLCRQYLQIPNCSRAGNMLKLRTSVLLFLKGCSLSLSASIVSESLYAECSANAISRNFFVAHVTYMALLGYVSAMTPLTATSVTQFLCVFFYQVLRSFSHVIFQYCYLPLSIKFLRFIRSLGDSF